MRTHLAAAAAATSPCCNGRRLHVLLLPAHSWGRTQRTLLLVVGACRRRRFACCNCAERLAAVTSSWSVGTHAVALRRHECIPLLCTDGRMHAHLLHCLYTRAVALRARTDARTLY